LRVHHLVFDTVIDRGSQSTLLEIIHFSFNETIIYTISTEMAIWVLVASSSFKQSDKSNQWDATRLKRYIRSSSILRITYMFFYSIRIRIGMT